ncbi:MAG: hypothetical protein ABIK83_15925 [Candidatus Zixiibacteriota bacterium]
MEDKAASCRKAIDACNEALKVRTYGDIPMQYALTLENAGLIYWTPAGDDNKTNDCANAQARYEQRLRILFSTDPC